MVDCCAIYMLPLLYVVSYIFPRGRGMSLDAAILGFLGERPRSGYDLKTRCFDHDARAFWTADQAQIYRTLERLSASRLVTSTRKRQAGKPDRRVYEITPAGRAALSSWLATTPPLSSPRDGFQLQMFFGAGLSEGALLEVLTAQRALHQKRLEELRADAIELAQDERVPPREAALREAAFDGAIAVERATIDWVDDVIESVEAGQLPEPGAAQPGSQRHLFGAEPP
jgi:PadR family transcriptional regulator, regulatory protein AphA